MAQLNFGILISVKNGNNARTAQLRLMFNQDAT